MRTSKSIYYTLGDIAYLEDPSWYPNTSSDLAFSTIMTRYGLVIEDSSTAKLSILYQIMRMVYSEYFHCDVYKKIVDIFQDETQVTLTAAELKEIWREFVGLFNLTAPRYMALLKSYQANESNPIAKVGSITTAISKFNDTPQGSGDYSDDTHTSTINQNSVSVEADSGSIAEKLDELYKNWRSIFKDWVYEFRCLFYVNK